MNSDSGSGSRSGPSCDLVSWLLGPSSALSNDSCSDTVEVDSGSDVKPYVPRRRYVFQRFGVSIAEKQTDVQDS